MSLSADQKAMLEMLLERRQSYAELGDLLGLDEAEVRSRARQALTALGGADPDRRVSLTDYLLGQADPIGRADAARHLGADAEDAALAGRIAAELRELAPGAELPKLPGAPAGGGFMRRTTPAPAPAADRAAPSGRGRMLALLGGGAAVLVVVVLAIAGVFGGDDEGAASTTPTTTDPTATNTDTVDAGGQEVSRIRLQPEGGGDAAGLGVIGLTTGDQPYLDLVLENLDPAPNGQVYVIWFLINETGGYPLSPIAPDDKGSFSDRFAIPAPAIEIAARMRFLNVSLAPIDEVQAKIQDALDKTELVIDRPGQTVLQGEVPAAGQPSQPPPANDQSGNSGQGG